MGKNYLRSLIYGISLIVESLRRGPTYCISYYNATGLSLPAFLALRQRCTEKNSRTINNKTHIIGRRVARTIRRPVGGSVGTPIRRPPRKDWYEDRHEVYCCRYDCLVFSPDCSEKTTLPQFHQHHRHCRVALRRRTR